MVFRLVLKILYCKNLNSTTDIQDVNELNHDINTFMDLSTCIYKSRKSIDKITRKRKDPRFQK